MTHKLRIHPTSVNNGVGDSSAYITIGSNLTKTLVISKQPGLINRFRERIFDDLSFVSLTLELLDYPIQLLVPSTWRMWNIKPIKGLFPELTQYLTLEEYMLNGLFFFTETTSVIIEHPKSHKSLFCSYSLMTSHPKDKPGSRTSHVTFEKISPLNLLELVI
ncbi:unnamed protein product [Vicia faba]|uniref:Uncharacterized protein n=1 Tax=Vicia faba TaxID=3906 RepID=A0AAV0YIV6_VICFA|nr:unnamed protein product [Vicia faba]